MGGRKFDTIRCKVVYAPPMLMESSRKRKREEIQECLRAIARRAGEASHTNNLTISVEFIRAECDKIVQVLAQTEHEAFVRSVCHVVARFPGLTTFLWPMPSDRSRHIFGRILRLDVSGGEVREEHRVRRGPAGKFGHSLVTCRTGSVKQYWVQWNGSNLVVGNSCRIMPVRALLDYERCMRELNPLRTEFPLARVLVQVFSDEDLKHDLSTVSQTMTVPMHETQDWTWVITAYGPALVYPRKLQSVSEGQVREALQPWVGARLLKSFLPVALADIVREYLIYI
jgi:hypothetical protein